MSVATIPDHGARLLAQREFDRPVVVEAGAGTGKTTLLVARIAAWCLGPGWELESAEGSDEGVARAVLDGLVAITFTEAAAADMAAKVATALTDLARGESPEGFEPDPDRFPSSPEEVVRRARAVLGEIHRLRIHTIHAFCQRLLRAYPLEAGIHPWFEIDAHRDRVEAVVQEVVGEALDDDATVTGADWQLLAARGHGPAAVGAAVAELVAEGWVPTDIERDPFDPLVARARRAALRDALAGFREVEGGRFAHVKGSRTIATRDALDRLERSLADLGGDAGYRELAECCRNVDDDAWKRLRSWARSILTKAETSAVEGREGEAANAAAEVCRELEPLRDLAVSELEAARRAIAPLLEEVWSRLGAEGVMTYDGLLTATLSLLTSSPEVCAEVRRGIRQLMVDEFQDTDLVQCRIVERLALDDTGGGRALPSLFVVGDPKQSIYGWRRADLAAYDRLVARITGDAGGHKVELTANFRSAAPILAEVERLVAPVMMSETGVQARFEPLLPTGERIGSVGFDHSWWTAVEHWVGWGMDSASGRPDPGAGRTDDAVGREAVAIAEDIRRLHDRAGVAWGTIAILLRTMSSQEPILDALRAWDVPHEITREREYYRQREVVEAASLVRCVLEPSDVLALLAVMRSDLVGVPDAMLAPLWDRGFAARMAEVRHPGDEPSEAAAAVVEALATEHGDSGRTRWWDGALAAVDLVAALREIERTRSPDRFVSALRRLSCAEITAAARYLGRVRVARLERFFAELGAVLEETSGSPPAVARFLRSAVEEGRDSRLPPEPVRDADAVQVMTVHGAKGLDFDHVYLAQIHKQSGAAPGSRPFRRGGRGDRRDYELLGWPTPGMADARAATERREAAERVRLLYVAATRARQRLVLSGWWSNAGAEIEPAAASSFGDLVARRASASDLAERAERGQNRWDDAEPAVQWRLPALDPPASPPAAAADAATADDLLDPLERDVATLTARRSESRVRRERTLSGRMSSEGHREAGSASGGGGGPVDREAATRAAGLATAAGTAVHALMEELDLSAQLDPQLAELRRGAFRRAAEGLPGDDAALACARIDELIHGLEGSRCLARLGEIGVHVVGREVPLIDRPASGSEALLWEAGTVDLVYRDPATAELVVADYKTDRVADDDAIRERVERYAPQLERYGSVLAAALRLASPVRLELWFLDADRIVTVGSSAAVPG